MTPIRSAFRALAGASLLACVPLSSAGPIHYGFSVHTNFPMGDLHRDLNGKVGLGASFQVSFETSQRTIVRPRIDLDAFPVSEQDRAGTDYRDRVDLESVGLGADFLYSFSGTNNQGLYGLAGLGVQRWIQNTSSRKDTWYDGWRRDETVTNRTSPYLALGMGYQFNPIVGLEARVVGSRYDALVDGTAGSRTALVSQLALTCRW